MVARNRTESDATSVTRTIAGKAVLLNGGSSGIGRATARLLAANGARVLIFGRDEQQLKEAVKDAASQGGEVYGIAGDVAKRKDVQRLFKEADKRLGQLDVLINNAAIAGHSLLDSDYDAWKETLDVNILGYMACAREALDRMRPRREGHLLMVGSMSADLREASGDVYAATKAAVQAFCEALRKNVNEDGIRVTLIEPGAVDTPLQTKPQAEKNRKKKKMEMLEPADIAECILFALSQPKRCDIVQMQVRPLKQLI